MKNFKDKLKQLQLFKSAETRFLLMCAFKFTAVPIFVTLFFLYVLWIMLSYNNMFFQSTGFLNSPEVRTALFTQVEAVFHPLAIYTILLLSVLFLTGIYVGKILLRPFKLIGDYCLSQTNSEKEAKLQYSPDLFSDYRLLSQFTERFFAHLDEVNKTGQRKKVEILPRFAKIRGPIFEKIFFFHFSLFIGTITIFVATLAVYVSTEIKGKLVELALQVIPEQGSQLVFFMNNQTNIFNSLTYVAVFMISLSYFALSVHLYGKVSGAVFAYFSTMRTYLRGNTTARVHLIGYGHIREYGRAFNKYLDYIERNLEKTNK